MTSRRKLTEGAPPVRVIALALVAILPMSPCRASAQDVPSSASQLPRMPMTFRIGPQRPDLVRYNRVEALSLGVRVQIRPSTPVGPLSLTGTARLGIADVHPNGRLDVVHESIERRIVLSGYHELAAIDERARHFGLANSLMAFVAGQDDGDYYRRSGATLEWTPPTASPRSYRVRAYAEYQEGVEKQTDVQVPRLWDEDAAFRPNIDADDGWEYGGSVELAVRWGRDLRRTRGGLGAVAQAGAGAADYARASAAGDVTFSLPWLMALSVEGEGGTSWGSPSTQRLWYVGGPLTLHGYAPRALGGESFWRGRAELDRSFAFGRFLVFTDVAWAGARSDFGVDDALSSAGLGLALIDGILRVDGGWRLERPHRFRLDVYLDQLR